MKTRKLVYGISGIGNGHTYRQLPLIEHFSYSCQMLIFAYGQSFEFYAKKFRNHRRVRVVKIAVPFVVGSPTGLDFNTSLRHPANQGLDFFRIQFRALALAQQWIGRPDLVISDYEPVAAQYAYAFDAPLVTIDQQSKYLIAQFPAKLGGFTYQDEIFRLRMFFPRAHARIACSFFNVPHQKKAENIILFPPILKLSVLALAKKPTHRDPNTFLIYLSSARDFVQTPEQIVTLLARQTDKTFHLFVPRSSVSEYPTKRPNLKIYPHGSSAFLQILERCAGVITTAGHSLLSECMSLELPVYAIPVAPYEQHMNARILQQNGFGISAPRLDARHLSLFLRQLSTFQAKIQKDKTVLLKGSGKDAIIQFLEKIF